MAEARTFTKHEFDRIFINHWAQLTGERKAWTKLQETKDWLGIRQWEVLRSLPFDPNNLDSLFNVLPRAMAAGRDSREVLSWLLTETANKYADKKYSVQYDDDEPPVSKVEGNVIHASFGGRHETVNHSDM